MAFGIPCIKELYETVNDKELFFKYVSYGILSTYYNSPYKSFAIEIRDAQLKRDIFGSESFKLPDDLVEFVEKLSKFSSTPSLRLLNAAENGLDFLIDEYNGLREKAGKVDEKGKPLVTIGDVSKWLKELEAAIKAFERVKESVMKEEITVSSKVRGQAEIGMYEDSLPS